MELGTLSAFCTLAKTLNFTKTADIHYISQSSLSRQISQLEAELGVSLLVRNTRGVELSAYGKVFLEDAEAICLKWRQAAQRLGDAKKGILGNLSVGFMRDHPNDAFSKIVRAYRERYPLVRLSFHECTQSEIGPALANGQVDAAFGFSECFSMVDCSESMTIAAHPLCAVVSVLHPFAGRDEVRLSDLRDEPIVMISPESSFSGYLSVLGQCRSAGFEPKIAATTGIIPSLFMLVEAGIGVAMLPRSSERIAPATVRFVPIENDAAGLETALAWRTAGANPSLTCFIEIAKKVL